MANLLLIAGVSLLAIVVLAVLDNKRRYREEERCPLEDRIAEIASNAAITRQQILDSEKRRTVPSMKADRFAKLIDYFLRLEALATTHGVSLREIDQFAKESREFMQREQLKGINIPFQAERLAKLIRRQRTTNLNDEPTS